ncbi:MFS transporter [Campylobacter fetus subsp. testudinum]|nr:MFS transporter [Campylobacter fetus]AGZ82016.1 major facilitator superfamily transporter, possible sugar permease [Campylobacter fetus subsp. testudinum 03-427]AJB45752.1 MFS transporter [Campylobacter fetus subsp. testudinum]ALV65182.1 major facilitator superfamily transporter, possible sugar permease [Campylobacter fetus subsp. testudinum Sp3]OCR84968.1 MFS transporter [Campylobacter fetus subsp. testudinum]OCR86873.1 MFS transporter [Campylobacter fetus subsp. testudinum]
MISSKRVIISLSALFFGMSFIFIANGLVVSSAGVLLTSMNADKTMIGVITSFFFIGALTCTVVSHRLISKVGHMRAYAIFTAIFAISALSHDLSKNLIVWAALRFMLGFCYYSIVMVIESWLNAKTANSIRSRVLAFYEIIFYSCFGLGAVIMSLNLDATKVFLIGTIFIILGSIPLNFLKVRSPQIPQTANISLPKIYGIAPLALATSIVAGLLINGFFSMSALFILAQGYSAKEAGVFIVSSMCGGFLSHMFFGVLSDKFGRKFAIILASCIALISSLLFIVIKPTINIQYIFAFFLGIGIFVLYALALARANDVIEDKSRCVEVGRALLFSYLLGSFFSPLIIGFSINTFGDFGFIYFYSLTLTLLIVFAIFQKSIPKELEVAFTRHSGHSVVFDELKDDNNKQ